MNKKKGGKRGKMVPLDFTGGAGEAGQGSDAVKVSDKDINYRAPVT
jgi:hypothetical protein